MINAPRQPSGLREHTNLVVSLRQLVVEFFRLALHEDSRGVGHQGAHAEGYQDGDKDGADGVGHHPAEEVHQDGGDDDADAAQGVRQDVEENPLHDLGVAADPVAVAVMAVAAATVGMAVAPAAVAVAVAVM